MNRVLVVLAVLTATARADDTVARDAYLRAEELAKAQHWAEACPLYEASYRADPQIGVLLHLADCHEHVGKLASAWAAFTDAADLARTRQDPREAIARQRADALVPRLSKLLVTAPPADIAGLVVTRDGVNITVLVGKELPVDPGAHAITASAPGHASWTGSVTIAAPGLTTVPLPALDKLAEPAPVKHEGTLAVHAPPGAEIWLDSQRVGTGSFSGPVAGNTGHSLRVVAAHKRSYQNEVYIADNQQRTIDVVLDDEVAVRPAEDLPAFELAASLAPGVKLRSDNPVVLALRVEAALRLGRRVNLGLYGEYGRIDTTGACGTDISGPAPATPYDFGPRHQMTSCAWLMPGLQLYIHVLPKRRIDPFIGVAPGFRFGGIDYTETFADQMPTRHHRRQLAIVSAVRAGVTYHPKVSAHRWTIGGYLDGSITIIGDDENVDDNGPVGTYLTLFAGARSTVQF